MIERLHGKLKKGIFKSQIKDWHYLLFNVLLVLIIIFPITGAITSLTHAMLQILTAVFIIYGVLLLNKPSLALVVSGLFAMLVLISSSGSNLVSISLSYWIVVLEILSISVFFLLLGLRLIVDMFKEEVSLKFIYISIANYLIMGILFNFLFQLVHSANSRAFNFSPDTEYAHIYMSFMTLTGVGSSDFLPASNAGKSLIILEAIVGQLYSTFFVAIIIGKYLNRKNSHS